MKYIIVLSFVLFSKQLLSQSLNTELKATLDSILILDQVPRALMDPNISSERKANYLQKLGMSEDEFYKNPWGVVIKNDSVNLKKIVRIIDEYGYPGKSLVGEPTNRTVWYVIQHSDKIGEYLPIIKKAGEAGELPMTSVAMMEDRYLMEIGEEQIYGTQVYGGNITDQQTGERHREYIVWPIKDPEKVDEIRKSIGFIQSLKESALDLGVEYKVYTLKQAKTMFDEFK